MDLPRYTNSENTVTFDYRQLAKPKSEAELTQLLKEVLKRGGRLKVVGGTHTFNHITKTSDTLVDLSSMENYGSTVEVDAKNHTITCGGGMQLGDAIEAAYRHGLSFPNLGSWYQQKLGGAIATGVHGSSLAYGSISDLVIGIEAIKADGTKIELKGNDEALQAWRVHLGQLGIVSRVKLQLVPNFDLECKTTDHADDREGFAHLYNLLEEWDTRKTPYLSHLWLPYFGDHGRTLTRVLRPTRPQRPNEAARAQEKKWIKRDRNIVVNAAEDRAMQMLGTAFLRFPRQFKDMWSSAMANAFLDDNNAIDRSFRIFLYDQYREPTENHWMRMIMNAEYALDVDRLPSAVDQIRSLLSDYLSSGKVVNLPRFHIRFAPPSTNTWLGMNAGRRTAYFGTYPSAATLPANQIPIFRELEAILNAHDGRPHWGKCRYLGADQEFKKSYGANWQRFEAYRRQLDPTGVFSDGSDMFADLNLFDENEILQKPLSDLNPENYFPIRYLGGKSSEL